MTRLLVLGGTGDMGILLIRKALDAGHIVTVYARNPSKLPKDISSHESVIIDKGELTDEESLRHAIRHCHAILSNLGPGTTPSHFPGAHPPDLPLAKAYSLILRIMKEPDVECKRIILLGTVSIPDPNDKRDMAIWTLVQGVKWTAYDAYADEVAIGETIRREGDGIEWTIVRVPLLTKSENEAVVAGYIGGPKMGTHVSRAGFAAFCLSELVKREWVLKAPMIASKRLNLIFYSHTQFPNPQAAEKNRICIVNISIYAMGLNHLPPKIILIILSLVPRESLASSSLVCKTWRTAAYAVLYESTHLVSTTNGSYSSPWLKFSRSNNHPEELVHRVISETDDDGPFQISGCIRRLTVAWEMNEQQLQTFGSAVLRMKNLENLSWIVSVIDHTRWYDTLVLLCKRLPKLRSVKLVIGEHELDIPEMDMGALIGLRELAIGFDPQEETFEWEIPNATTQFIVNAQNIESLTLWAEASHIHQSAISYNFVEDDIMSKLSLHRFPHLRRFSIGPFHSEVSFQHFVDPNFGLWRFARNQKQLREVVCYAKGGSMLGWDIPSGHTESVPMMHRFKGSAFEVRALLRFNLARQLEILELAHTESSASAGLSDSRLSDLLEVLRNTHGIELPCLRSLELSMSDLGIGTSNNMERAINVLGILASGAPKLQELIVSTSRPPTPYIQASPAQNIIQNVYLNTETLN